MLDASIWGPASVAVGLVAIVVAYLIGRARAKKEPCWSIRSINLVRDFSARLHSLQISYHGDPVENLTISRVLFWNRGSETIADDDFTNDPLRIVTKAHGVRILDKPQVIANNSEPSEFDTSLDSDGSSALLVFKYLDQGQGAVIDVVHTGVDSDDIEVCGTLRGVARLSKRRIQVIPFVPLPSLVEERLTPKAKRRITALVAAVWLIVPLIIIGTTVAISSPDELLSLGNLVPAAFLVVGTLLALGFVMHRTGYILGTSIPPGLEAFEDDVEKSL